MKETKTERMTRRTSALLLAGILCVSAFAGSASAQGKSETQTQASQTQQAEKESPSDSASPKMTDKAAEETDAAVPSQTVKVVPGNCVRLTVHVDKDADTKDGKASDGAGKARIEVEVLEKAEPLAAEKEDKQEDKKENADDADKAEKAESPTYSWQVNRQNGQGWKSLFMASGDRYQIRKVIERQNGWEYRCIITNGKDSIESAHVTLELGDPSAAADNEDSSKKTD